MGNFATEPIQLMPPALMNTLHLATILQVLMLMVVLQKIVQRLLTQRKV